MSDYMWYMLTAVFLQIGAAWFVICAADLVWSDQLV
jgi:hypothetical protein